MQLQGLSTVAIFAVLGSLATPQAVHAQTPPPFQVGAQFATLRVGDIATTNAGFGGRASLDVSRWLSVEGEFNVFPNDRFETGSSLPTADLRIIHQRRRVDALFGPKIGYRRERFGLFGSVRPGFSRLTNRGIRCGGRDCALILLAVPEYRTEFALDFGGVFEVYPTAHTVARVDVGDTVIWHRSFAPPCDDCSTHNLATRLGFGVRF